MSLVLPVQGSNPPVTLEADVYYPDGEGPFPVLLMRQPYGRAIASTVVYAHPTWYASHGYIVVIQDVRGRGTSGGEFSLFHHEVEDGYATVLWAANLPQSSGAVGMYGFSYQGMTQLYAASRRPEPLKTIAPAMVGYAPYADWAYENGALLLHAGLGWALQLAAETCRREGKLEAYQVIYQAAHQLPLDEAIPTRPKILQELAADSFWHDWLVHPQQDDYWQALQPDLSEVDLPMLHIGGWCDPYLRGDLRLYHQMKTQSSALQHLWVGPWGHLPWSRRVGAVDFGPEAESPIDRLQIRWFNHILKGEDNGLGQAAPVRLFEMGRNRWQGFDQWPAGQEKGLYLTSSGLASMRQDDGHLVDSLSDATPTGQDVIVHDPWRPVPSLGGHSSIPAGSFDRGSIDSRSDVLTYTTAPFIQPLRVAGAIKLELYGQADAPSFDLSAVVSEVYTDGRVMNLTQGYGRAETLAALFEPQQEPQRLTLCLTLQATCFAMPVGHALRLSLAAAAFPAYPVNSGTGQPVGEVALIDYRVITLTVWHGPDYPSQLRLPMTPAGRF
ncbi:MAG: CocE/NonD family hydrolase [Leptolyngbyaceae cyanobacterium SM2_5_2]|nr:CocE/NonD family hydrolase [Leptolyngbyaceae cyanobacterium SM2_5_2]